MSIATVVDAQTGARLGIIVGLGFSPADVTGPDWRFRAWRDQDGILRTEPTDPAHPKMYRADVMITARHSDKPLPELFVPAEYLDFIKSHPAFRVL